MRPSILGRFGLTIVVATSLVTIVGCRGNPTESQPSQSPKGAPGQAQTPLQAKPELQSEITPAVLASHFKGLGFMEQYKYREAVEAFREVNRLAPQWIPGAINLAIALLNDSGVEAEKAKKSGADAAPSHFDEALDLLAGVIAREPRNPYAHFCRGVILEQQGKIAAAHEHFKQVTEIDPNDGAAWYWTGSTLPDRDNPTQPAGPDQAREQIALYGKALECDPYLVPAVYKMALASRFTGEPKGTKELFDRWNRMNPDRPGPTPGPGDTADKVYGEMGRYATVVNPFARADPKAPTAARLPNFGAAQPLAVKLAAGDRWVKKSDFTGPLTVVGRVRDRFGAAVAAFDADGDGRIDLFLAAAVAGPKGVHDVLLLNQGDGQFEDATLRFGLAPDRASLGAAAADFDADRRIDLFLTGVGGNVLLRNRDGKSFENISPALKTAGPPALSLMARWLDLDQDGDLDLYVVNYCPAEHAGQAFLTGDTPPPPGLANTAYRNDGQPAPIANSPPPTWAPLAVAVDNVKATAGLSIALNPWPDAQALAAGIARHSGIASLDIDNDRDLDLIVTADDSKALAIVNDRGGQFHVVELDDLTPIRPGSGLLVTDLDADGRADLVATSALGRVLSWRNSTERTTTKATRLSFDSFPTDAKSWRAAQAIDLDLDGLPDLLGLPAAASGQLDLVLPAWARNDGKRLTTANLPVQLDGPGPDVVMAIDLVGDPLPDLLCQRPGEPPAILRNLGNGHHWLALDLRGRWQVRKEMMRTNPHAIGTRVLIEGQGTHVTYEDTTPETGLGQSIAPIVVGLGQTQTTELLHLRWPDGVLQCELNVTADQKLDMTEKNRKTSSCPVLFTWNGQRFVCVCDFLGGGGLGYLVAPGVYGLPDRDEAVAITDSQLRPADGVFRLSITEPMDEVSYIDQVHLDVVDRPQGVTATPDERFAPEGPRPTGELIAWRDAIRPARATDLDGRDVTDALREWDRQTVDRVSRRDGWIGYTFEHGIILDFADRLAQFKANDRLVLCLAGWVEYPYSQTNYAAATAGVALAPPVLERLTDDGHWEIIEPYLGYPAGSPRMMTRDLTGKLLGPRCVLRIKTNMECYYDQAMIAVRDGGAERSIRVTTLPVAGATLGYRGYTREISPDGKQPLIYDYDYTDPAPLARFSGKLTRYGDVRALLQTDDDQHCLVGPGDEARIEFDATKLPALPAGWTRSYVLRTTGYCKDADPFTARSDTIEPLPWRGMPPFPFGDEVRRPGDPAYESYLRTYQTRPAGRGD